MKVHILDDWFDTLRGLPSFARLEGHDVTIWTDHVEDVDILADRLAPAEALVLFRERTPITEALLARLPKLRLISQRSVYPHVDVPACTEHGVLLSSNMHSDTASIAASELTFALILASARQIPQQMASLQAGRWQMGVGQTLAGRRLGLYGYGRIARQVAIYAAAFGMQIWWWASEDGRARAAAAGETVAPDRRVFFAQSDFVSLHVRLKPETRGIVTEADLLAMRPSASFLNTSRAGLVAPGALDAALAQGRPGRIALDVFETEPLTEVAHPLVTHPAVIATPHIGYVTEDELDLQFADIYDQILAYAAGRPIHMINPEVLGGS
ncbi:MAG: D-2-hydroxyacid dehydrogenase family protein [Pseudomonadota bacterium]